MLSQVGFGGFLLLCFLPGAWIAFGLSLDGIKYTARLLTAMMLSPLVVCGEFYVIRLLGVPFETTAVLLVILNLPAGYWIWRRRAADRIGWPVAAAAIAVPVISMISLLLHPDVRIFGAHSWIHGDAAYMFARGGLVLEDPTLAGMVMPYPVWSPLVFEAVHGYLVNTPPMVCYVWSNLLWLIGVCGFAVLIVKEMGGGRLAQLSSGMLLLFGANPVGHILVQLAPAGAGLWGDARYTPWVQKFLLFGPMTLALGMFMALIFLLIQEGPPGKGLLAVVCLLLSGIGLLYPLLFPSACAITGVKALAPLLGRERRLDRATLAWIGILLIAVTATYLEVRFLTAGRLAATGPIELSTLRRVAGKIGASLIATCIFLAGAVLVFRDCWRSRRPATVVLVGGALASYSLYIVFHVLYYENEYKFIFAAVMCLMAFPALAVESIWREWPRPKAATLLTGTALLVLGAYADWVYLYWPAPWVGHTHASYQRAPLVDATAFRLQMDPRETWSGVCNAVFSMTPANSILLLDDSSFYYPLLTGRSLYVSPANKIYPGINLNADDLDADVRGYGREIIQARRSTLAAVFGSGETSRREPAIREILSLQRPVAIVAESRHSELLDWLRQSTEARQLFVANGLSLWLIDANRSRRY